MMYLTRKLLEELRLDEAAMDAVMRAHQATLDGMRGEWEKELMQAQTLRDAAKERDELQAEVERLKMESERADRAEAEFREYREKEAEKAERAQREALMTEALKRAGVSEKVLPLVMKAVDADTVRIADGSIENEEEMVSEIRRQWAGCFVQERPEPVAGAHAVRGGMRMTREDIGRMTAEEINDQWSSVREALRG